LPYSSQFEEAGVSAEPETYDSLEAALKQTGFAWSLCLVGEDQANQLAALTNDLRRPFSNSGDGKRIVSGFSYWGAEPTYAWARACGDPLYPVMRESIRSFPQRWRSGASKLQGGPWHYVSLGPGTGEKDRIILATLFPHMPELRYMPVDMSTEMLQTSAREVSRDPGLDDLPILPVQLDFSLSESVTNFRRLLDVLIGDAPVLFSLLGNTLANFDEESRLLADLTANLLRPNDRLLLEVATAPDVSTALAGQAADEYRGSGAFCNFVTSALLHRTDLTIDMDAVSFEGAVESGERAIVIKMIYRNITGQTMRVVLGDRSLLTFAPDDTIRLHMTRKYSEHGLQRLLAGAGLQQLDSHPWKYKDSTFGLNLLLLGAQSRGGASHPIFDLDR
jgi:uncharacterized SAM-dependent methyltransferase